MCMCVCLCVVWPFAIRIVILNWRIYRAKRNRSMVTLRFYSSFWNIIIRWYPFAIHISICGVNIRISFIFFFDYILISSWFTVKFDQNEIMGKYCRCTKEMIMMMMTRRCCCFADDHAVKWVSFFVLVPVCPIDGDREDQMDLWILLVLIRKGKKKGCIDLQGWKCQSFLNDFNRFSLAAIERLQLLFKSHLIKEIQL